MTVMSPKQRAGAYGPVQPPGRVVSDGRTGRPCRWLRLIRVPANSGRFDGSDSDYAAKIF